MAASSDCPSADSQNGRPTDSMTTICGDLRDPDSTYTTAAKTITATEIMFCYEYRCDIFQSVLVEMDTICTAFRLEG
jgi:hypothetical protein